MVAALICMMLAIPAMAMALSSLLVVAEDVDDTAVPTPLIACKNVQIGSVDVWNDFDYLYVKYEITVENWGLLETHCQVETDPDSIPQMNGNPTPEKFVCIADHDPVEDEYTCCFDLSDDWPAGTQLFVAAHAKVVNEDLTVCAWGAGIDFEGPNWATYIAYTVKSWDLEGDWVLRFIYGTTNYDHDMDASVVQKSDGTFTATGGYPAGGTYSHTWKATGTVDRDEVEFHIEYLTGNIGYEAWVEGVIELDGSMSGTWHATGQPGPYSWESLSGAAVWC